MKNVIAFSLISVLFFLASCSKDDSIQTNEDKPNFEIGHSFKQVAHTYENISTNGVQYVNQTLGVQNNISNGYTGDHWVYQSPSLEDQEIGFSIVYPENYNGEPLDVVLFLHGSNGTENNGASLFFDSFITNFSETEKVLIFANGIYNSNAPGVWKLREMEGRTFNHNFQLIELISGIIENDTLFPFAKKTTQDWSVVGFSAGGQVTLGMYMDPIFIENPKYQPKNIMPLGAWASNYSDYLDFEEGLEMLPECGTEIELTIVNHVLDDVICGNNIQYEQKTGLLNKFDSKNIRYTYLGLQDEATPCEPGEANPIHSVKFYLRNQISNTLKDITCRDASYLDNYTVLGNILFGE